MSDRLSIKKIEKLFLLEQLTPEETLALLINRTERSAEQLKKRVEKKLDLIQKYHERSSYYHDAIKNGYKVIAGLDEVGRGPLAGPVTAACVVLDSQRPILGLRDSKRLSAKRREELSDEIREKALAFSIVSFSEKTIDELNILEATKQAMIMAVESLDLQADFLLLDAINLDIDIAQLSIVSGDEKCNEISAASIIAKVERDRYMRMIHERYPKYRFDKNKGYGTQEHIQAIKDFGPCPIHRKTFIQRII